MVKAWARCTGRVKIIIVSQLQICGNETTNSCCISATVSSPIMKSASLAVILMAYSVDAFTGLRNLCQLEGIRNPPTIDRTYRVIGGSNDLSYDNVSIDVRSGLKGLACSCLCFTPGER